MKKQWLEPSALILFFSLIYFVPIQSANIPVFSGEFNNLDGSLYVVRFFDMLVSVALMLLASRQLIPHRLDFKTIFLKVSFFAGLVMLMSLAEWGWDELTLRLFNLPTEPGEISDKMLMNPRRETLNLTILQGNLIPVVLGLFYGLMRDRNHQLRRQEQLEKDTLEAEVKHLRSQINPHFLFNTLNNIFAITQRNEDTEGSDALLRLSGLMRYMLYETTEAEISLEREIEHLQNYSDLMLLKYKSDDPPAVKFEVSGNPETFHVAPLILLPFVENAFKHGISNQGKGTIEISLKASSKELNFSVVNSRFPERIVSEEHKGIGLENVKQRLELLYRSQYHLDIKTSDEQYRINLRITS